MSETAAMSIKEAITLREREVRVSVLADAAVAATFADRRERGAEFNHEFEREVREGVWQAAVHLVAMIYEGDAELKALRHERDAYRDRSLEMLNVSPARLVFHPDPAA